MITADTITDEQIRELRDWAWCVYAEATNALGMAAHGFEQPISYERQRSAKVRVAEILNARSAVGK